MESKKLYELRKKVETAMSVCNRCDECPYGDVDNGCPKQLHRDVRTLIDAFKEQMSAVIAEKNDICRKVVDIENERMYLEKRLKHLLQSETIRQFDAISSRNGDYERDISDLDEMMKNSVQKRAAEAIFAQIAKNCEKDDMSAEEIKKHVEVFDHMRQACKGEFTRLYR